MVSYRQGDYECNIPPGEGNPPQSQRVDFRMKNSLLCLLCLLWFLPSSFAQAIYAENQLPARGVDIEYTVNIRNPISHLYDIEMSIKGIRDTSLSLSMPAWSPGIYRIDNYAR